MPNDYDPAMTRAGNVLIVLAVLLGGTLTACSSDGASPAATTMADTVVPSTEPTVDSTSPTTTTAPTTTVDPAVALAAAVEADFLEADRLGREASQDPFNAEKEQAALDRRVGVIATSFELELAELRAKNYAIRPNPVTPSSLTVEVPAALLREAADVAELQICEINAWILVEVGAGPAGSDAVVNPDVIASRSTVFLRKVDDVWKIEGGNEIERWEGASECPAE